jgi:hypothetical protein
VQNADFIGVIALSEDFPNQNLCDFYNRIFRHYGHKDFNGQFLYSTKVQEIPELKTKEFKFEKWQG